MDRVKIENAIKLLLEGIGENPEREGLKETPKRVARMYEEVLSGMDKNPKDCLCKRFSAKGSELVLERDIQFYSLCEHHILPFFGKVHIAYIPNDEVVGLSKLARTVEVYARRLQIQERMTMQIADAIMNEISPKGLIVVAEAQHLCMEMRGVKKNGTNTITIATRGSLKEENKKNILRMLGM